jgi:hypothetical protein
MADDYSRQKSRGDRELIMNGKVVTMRTEVDRGWVRSSRCVPNNNCVEVRVARDGVGVRDSKNAGGAVLAFRLDRWTGFLARTVQ